MSALIISFAFYFSVMTEEKVVLSGEGLGSHFEAVGPKPKFESFLGDFCLLARSMITTAVLPAIAVMAISAPVFAEDYSDSSYKQYVLDLGAGVKYKPKYPGADEYIFSPFPLVAVSRFYVPGIGEFGDGGKPKSGFSLFPSFDFNGERKASNSSDLAGTKTIDWALELGAGAAYR